MNKLYQKFWVCPTCLYGHRETGDFCERCGAFPITREARIGRHSIQRGAMLHANEMREEIRYTDGSQWIGKWERCPGATY